MFDTNYNINSLTVGAILGLIEAGTIAIPEIQRPFVWKRSKVRDLIDSMYNGYPTGYIIRWQSPNVKIKNGGESAGKFLLIDGQQRITTQKYFVYFKGLFCSYREKDRGKTE